MSTDTRFLKSAKDKTVAAARAGLQFALENPRLSLGSGAAMLIAPAIFKNRDRGYLQTAAVTTPLIGAVTYAAPSLIGAFRSQFSKHAPPVAETVRERTKTYQTNKSVSYEHMRATSQDYSSGSTPLDIRDDTMRQYYTGRVRKSVNLTAESDALRSRLDRIFEVGPMRLQDMQYMSNSVHAELIHSAGAQDLVNYSREFYPGNEYGVAAISPKLLDRQDIRNIVHAHLSNPAFVKGMNSRISRMRGLKMSSDYTLPLDSMMARYSSVSWKQGGALQSSLRAIRPDLHAVLQRGIKSGVIKANQLELMTLEETGNPLVAIRYKGTAGLTIPIINADGSVRTGKGFRRTGIGGNVYTATEEMKSDVYAVEALIRGFGVKAVSQELQRANMYSGIEAADDFSAYRLLHGEDFVHSEGAFALRKYRIAPSNLFGFVNVMENGDQVTVGMNDLLPVGRLKVLEGAESRGFTAIGSESNVSKMIFQKADVNRLAPYGLPSLEKQNPSFRSYTKNVRLTKAPTMSPYSGHRIRDSLNVFSETPFMDTIAPGVDRREIGIRVGGITGGQKTLFGDLPDTVEGLDAYKQTAIRIMRLDQNISSNTASKAWMEYSNWLSSDIANLRAMKQLGRLGEGGGIMRKGLYGMEVETYSNYTVKALHVPDWKLNLGRSVEDILKVGPGQQGVLGVDAIGNPVVGKGFANYIENVSDMGDGTQSIRVRSTVPFQTGTKFDALVKGLAVTVDDVESPERGRINEWGRIREGINKYHSLVGSGGYIPEEVEQIQVLHYAQEKTDPIQSILNLTGDTFRRLEETGELDKIAGYRSKLEDLGHVYSGGVLKVPDTGGFNKFTESFNVIEQMFRDVSDRLRAGTIIGDKAMQAFAAQNKIKNYEMYAHTYFSPTSLRVWDSTQFNLATESRFTYDMAQQLSLRGHHGVLADITDRLTYDGDLHQTQALEEYLKGNTSAISHTMDLSEGVSSDNPRLFGMNSPEGRAGTFLDPGFERSKDNFLMKLPDGSTVPVLGHNAYGGKEDRFGAKYSINDHEKSLIKVIRRYNDKIPDEARIAAAKEEYLGNLKKFVYGKKGYMRSPGVDNEAALGEFIQTRASTLRTNGQVNPFEIAIGPDLVSGIRDEKIQAALHAFEANPTRDNEVYAAVTRHPVSDMPLVRVRIDRALAGTHIVGLDEGMRGLLMADDDADRISAFFMRPGSAGHREAAAAVHGENVEQWNAMRFQKSLEGMGDDPRSFFAPGSTGDVSELGLSDLFGKLKTLSVWKKPYSLDQALRARSTSASIGAFSNTLTNMLIGLEHNENVVNTGDKLKLSRFFFTSIRQGPISASKLKNQNAVKMMDLKRALGIKKTLNATLGATNRSDPKVFDKFYSALGELADSQDGPALDETGAFRSFLSSNRDLFKSYFTGFDSEAVAQATRVLVTPANQAPRAQVLGMSKNIMSYIRAAAEDTGLGAETVTEATGAGAKASSAWLGYLNQAKKAAGDVRGAMRESNAGIILGTGLAIAAVAGIVTSSTNGRARPIFTMASSNKYKSEDAGVPNSTPGSAWEGSRASRPARNRVAPQTQTRTAVVAPINETADLDVRMRAKDRDRAAETARMLRRAATDGDAFVTINYVDPKRTSLRSKERMKETLGE